MRPIVTVFAAAVTACSSSYHPEYHPITVSNFSQNVAYPVSASAPSSERPPLLVVPAAPQPVVILPEPLPPDFFR